jgi:hypothetical protein
MQHVAMLTQPAFWLRITNKVSLTDPS